MDHDEYVTARYGRLLEHAVELGCDDEDAPAVVDMVLRDQRRAIRRAEDPDPVVRAALARRLSGDAGGAGGGDGFPWRLGALGALGLVALLGVTLGVRAVVEALAPDPLPSVFGYDEQTARDVLEAAGLEVEVEQASACEPIGLALGTDPVAGVAVDQGTTVQLRVAVPDDPLCLAVYQLRSDAWQFVRFARGAAGAPPPRFAETVVVAVDDVPPTRVSGEQAASRRGLGAGARDRRRGRASQRPTRTGMPRLVVDSLVPEPDECGVVIPPGFAGTGALRLRIDASPTGSTAACPLTVDLYRNADRVIGAVVVSTGSAARLTTLPLGGRPEVRQGVVAGGRASSAPIAPITAWRPLTGRTITVNDVSRPSAPHRSMSTPWTVSPSTRVSNSSTALPPLAPGASAYHSSR